MSSKSSRAAASSQDEALRELSRRTGLVKSCASRFRAGGLGFGDWASKEFSVRRVFCAELGLWVSGVSWGVWGLSSGLLFELKGPRSSRTRALGDLGSWPCFLGQPSDLRKGGEGFREF